MADPTQFWSAIFMFCLENGRCSQLFLALHKCSDTSLIILYIQLYCYYCCVNMYIRTFCIYSACALKCGLQRSIQRDIESKGRQTSRAAYRFIQAHNIYCTHVHMYLSICIVLDFWINPTIPNTCDRQESKTKS